MARFEQPTYEVGRGGGIDMNEEALWVIENYLQLVRGYLDESIADDIIVEIRAYLIEAAEDLSQEEITVEAAKKVVAGFGAPSEVAKEYTSFLSTEEGVIEEKIPDELLLKIQQTQQKPVAEKPEIQKPLVSEVSYFSTFAKAITLIVSWLVISWTITTILVPWWSTTYSASAPFLQFLILVFSIALMLERARKSGIKLIDHTYPQWPGLQKLVTFPENSPLKPSENTRMLDIMLSIFGAGFFAVSFLNSMISYEYAVFSYIAVPAALVLTFRSIILVRELGGIDPARFVRQEYFLDAATIIFLNATISWGSYPYHTLPAPFSLFLWWYSFFYSINILYQLVVKGQEMWWEVVETPVSKELSTPRKEEAKVKSKALADKTKRVAAQSLVRITAIYIAMPLLGFFLAVLSGGQSSSSYWNMFGFLLVFFDFLYWLLAIGICLSYFGVRYYLIKSRGRTEIIRKRTRKESFIDLIITGSVLLMGFTSSYYLTRYLVPDFTQWLEGSNLLFRFVMLSIFVSLILYFYIGVIIRTMSDIINLIKGETTFTLKSMYFSGIILLLTIPFLFALSFVAHNFFYSWDFLLVLALFPTIIVSFQTVTTQMKLNWIKKNNRKDAEGSIEIE